MDFFYDMMFGIFNLFVKTNESTIDVFKII